MSEDAQLGKANMVRFERLLPGPVGRLWEFLTDTAKLPGWYGGGAIQPWAGGSVTLMGGHVRGVVTQWRPPRRLTYTWNVFDPGESESRYPDSYLTLELEPRGEHGDEVLLVLTHLPVLDVFERLNAMGWHTFLDMLGAALRGEPPLAREAYVAGNAARYGVDLSAWRSK